MAELGSWPGPIDLIGEDDLRHHRPGPVLKLLALLVEDADAGNIRGEQIRCKLDALKATANRTGQRLCQHGLADTGDILQQDMAFAKKRN